MTEAEEITTEQLVEVCQTVEPGDEIDFHNANHDYTNPLEVVETDVVEWLNPNGNWYTARLVLTTGRSERPVTAVEGVRDPRDRGSGGPFKVYRIEPISDGDGYGDRGQLDEFWCGQCGDGPMPEKAVRAHNEAVHDGGPIVWGVEPDFPDELPGDGEPLDGELRFTDHDAEPGSVPRCQNCGAHVSKQHARVMDPDSERGPLCCPACPDMVRDMGGVREKRGQATSDPTVVDSS